MSGIRSCIFGLVIFPVLVSCKEKELLPLEYIRWVKDYGNGVHKRKQVGDVIIDLQYKPADFIIVNELKGGVPDEVAYKQRMDELSSMQYFVLTLDIADTKSDFLKYGVHNEKEYYDKLYYYSFAFQNDIFLMDGEEKLPCKVFHFERSYDLKRSRSFVLGFARDKKNTADKILMIDSKVLDLGIVKVKLDQKDINSIPQLKI
jgi:hypothetical protein